MVPRSKKAQLFTILAVALIALMFLSIEIYSHFRDKDTINNRIKSMDAFLHALEGNLQRQAYISGYRILFVAQDDIRRGGSYIADIDDFFAEAFLNGTVRDQPEVLMNGATLDDMITQINQRAAKINVNVSLTDGTIFVHQDDPWHVAFVISLNVTMEDLQGLARWQKQENITAYIPVEGFDDPLYIINTNRLLGAPELDTHIVATPYDGYFNVSGNIANLSTHYTNGYYAANPLAPSFLNRMEGDLNANPNGIESFVKVATLLDQNIDVTQFGDTGALTPNPTKSVVDYIYFDKAATTTGTVVMGITTRLKIDAAHRPKYQVS